MCASTGPLSHSHLKAHVLLLLLYCAVCHHLLCVVVSTKVFMTDYSMYFVSLVCLCACVCACVCVRACACVCVRACVCVHVYGYCIRWRQPTRRTSVSGVAMAKWI